MNQISLQDLALFCKYDLHENPAVSKYLKSIYEESNFSCREAKQEEIEIYLSSLYKKISKKTARRSVEENLKIFNDGWTEHIAEFKKNPTLKTLLPRYYTHSSVGRSYIGTEGKLFWSENDKLSIQCQLICIVALITKYAHDFSTIHEFGSGTGINLYTLSEAFHDKTFIGYDWTDSGVVLADLIGAKTGRVSGRQFDMLNPSESTILQGDCVFTCASIEQLSENYQTFIDFLIRKKVGLVINIEPCTLHAHESPYFGLSAIYCKLRSYPENFSQYLKALEDDKKINIIDSFFLPFLAEFGSHSCTIWKPY